MSIWYTRIDIVKETTRGLVYDLHPLPSRINRERTTLEPPRPVPTAEFIDSAPRMGYGRPDARKWQNGPKWPKMALPFSPNVRAKGRGSGGPFFAKFCIFPGSRRPGTVSGTLACRRVPKPIPGPVTRSAARPLQEFGAGGLPVRFPTRPDFLLIGVQY